MKVALKKIPLSKVVFLLRSILFVGFLIPVIYQTATEVNNYGRGLKSTAMYSKATNETQYPFFVVCMDNAFKGEQNGLIMTTEEFMDRTYSQDEIFLNESYFSPPGEIRVDPLYTRLNGRCYVVKPSERVKQDQYVSIGLVNRRDVTIHFVNEGQELCVTLGYCNFLFNSIRLSNELVVVHLSIEKNIWPDK